MRAFVEERSERAFTELVRRHLDLVYSAALRMVRDGHLAQDVSQGVFFALARNADKLVERPVISGWLHRTAQNLAANAVRSEVRRRAREREVAAMKITSADQDHANWTEVAPQLDAALGELNEPDRDALLLRYFERKSAQQMAVTLGISSEAAQKRVNRAIDRLRDALDKRGVKAAAGGIIAAVSANAVQAAPAELAHSISSAGLNGLLLTSASKSIAMTAIAKTAAVTAIVIATLATVPMVVQYRQAAQAKMALNALQERVNGDAIRMGQLSNQLAQATRAQELAASDGNELPRLRGEINALRQQLDASRIAGRNSSPSPPPPDNYQQVLEAPTVPMIPAALWKNAGDATPEAAFQTLYWAMANHDTNTFSRTLAWEPGARAKCESLFAESPPAVQQHYGSIDGVVYNLLSGISPIGSYGIVSNYASGDVSTLLEQHQYQDGRVRQNEVTFHRFDGGWRLILGDEKLMRGFDAALKRAAAGGAD